MNRWNDNKLTITLTVCYVAIMIWIIVMKMSSFSELYMYPHFRDINLIPFHYNQDNGFHVIEVIGNMAIFIPLGVYLKMLGCSAQNTIICGVGMSLIFELTQYIFGIGASDITDLFMDSLGTAVGILIYNLLYSVLSKPEKLHRILNRIALMSTVILVLILVGWEIGIKLYYRS